MSEEQQSGGETNIGGDAVGGDKISVGSVSGAQAVAIGRGAQAIVNITELSKSDRLEQRNRGILLRKIQDFWIDEVFVPSVRENEYILLDKETDQQAIVNPLQELRSGSGITQTGEVLRGMGIAKVFETMNRSLLVLGKTGSGKTTSMLALTDHFVPLAAGDLNEPIPVVFNLSSWQNGEGIDAWLVRELNGIYGVPRTTGHQWLRESSLLLLLDGLDELPANRLEPCITALNAFRDVYGQMPMVVCCREEAYRQSATKLKLHGAIRIRPLNQSQIERYIGEALQPLRKAIANDYDLAKMATNFLVLKMLIEATLHEELEKLLALEGMEARTAYLVNHSHSEKLANMHEADTVYSLDSSDRYLGWLATRMVELQQSVFLFARMQPTWLKPVERFVYTILLMLLLTPLAWPVFAEMLYFSDAVLPYDWLAALASALGVAVLVPVRPVESLRWSLQSLRKNIIKFALTGVLIGGVFGALMELTFVWEMGVFQPVELLLFTAVFAVVGLTVGIIFSGLQSQEVDQLSGPNTAIIRSGMYGALVGVGTGILTWGLMVIILGLSYAEVVLIIGFLVYGGLAFIQHWVLRGVLIVFRHTPARYVNFLQEACDKDIMRMVGEGFIFENRMTLQHFADLTTVDDIIGSLDEEDENESLLTRLKSTVSGTKEREVAPVVATVSPGIPLGGEDDYVPVGSRIEARSLTLKGNDDLRRQILKYAEDNGIHSGVVLACQGTLKSARLEYPGRDEPVEILGVLSIVALTASLGPDTDSEMQIIVFDQNGRVLGGTLQEGSVVHHRAHVLLGVLNS